ncbi:phosphosulfolactate synthase [Methylocaldum sp.]|uniref:phosphosulfolactate synthase n=1 Tax=Methylocaldum sp. TaxID=1969727 RepID=UPI002D514CB5|nr:phosphosulfolactate synthase [Methylocaldum sp.]HYE34322.1 phosphosulfolactate synthase [Methylocaldum sp.]
MTSTPNSTPWHGFRTIDEGLRSRIRSRGESGLTMVIDTGLGMSATNDILDLSGAHIDHWKLGFGTSAVMPERLLRRKLDLLRSRGILTYPGGTLLEAALLHDSGVAFIERAKDLGFRAMEISEGTVALGRELRRSLIREARDAEIVPITEVGSKNPARQLSWGRVVEQAREDIDCGAAWVIMEGRECGINVGIYDDCGQIRPDFLEHLVEGLSDCLDRIIWEAPWKAQQCQLIHRFGANVNLGNIETTQCLALEALRCGLRFETLRPTVEALHPTLMMEIAVEPIALPAKGDRLHRSGTGT